MGDEHWTRLVARLPLSESLPFILQDGKHPPLYPILQMLGASVLPDTVLGLRLFSLLAVALIPVVTYVIAKGLWGTRLEALLIASWIAFHPVLLPEAANARSYALMALVVALYSSALIWWLSVPPRSSGQLASIAVFACLAVSTHAFGVLFVLSLAGAGLAYLFVTDGAPGFWSRYGRGRAVVLSHAPAVLFALGWFFTITIATREYGGIEAGLEWLTYPDNQERLHGLGILLGNPGFTRGTSVYFGIWGVMFAGIAWLAFRRRTLPLLGLMLVIAGLIPFLGQVLTSGIVTEIPLWGSRHVNPTPILLVMGVLIAVRTLALSRPHRLAVAGIFGLMTGIAAIGSETPSRNTLSRFATQIQATADSTAIKVTYEYGNLPTLNFYLDPRCLDTRQLRVQFPQVAGPASALEWGPHCRAEPLERDLPPSETRFFLVHRDFVPREVAARKRLLDGGWHISATVSWGVPGEPIIELLERVPQPMD